jgi:hypothetical protein
MVLEYSWLNIQTVSLPSQNYIIKSARQNRSKYIIRFRCLQKQLAECSKPSTDTRTPNCPKPPQLAKKAHATVERKKSAQCKKNVWSSPLCIKLQFLPTTTVKHTLVLLKTLLKLDITTTKRHLICTRKGTPQNSVNMSGS